jgi:hypothetical protein
MDGLFPPWPVKGATRRAWTVSRCPTGCRNGQSESDSRHGSFLGDFQAAISPTADPERPGVGAAHFGLRGY